MRKITALLLLSASLSACAAQAQIVRHPPADAAAAQRYSQAVEAGGFIFLAGFMGQRADGAVVEGGMGAETTQALANARAALQALGHDLSDVVSCTCYLADLSGFAAFNAAYAEAFRGHVPARSVIGVAALPRNASVQIECVALRRTS